MLLPSQPEAARQIQLECDGGRPVSRFAWNVPLLQAVEMGATEIYVLAVVATALPFRRSFRGLPDFLLRLGPERRALTRGHPRRPRHARRSGHPRHASELRRGRSERQNGEREHQWNSPAELHGVDPLDSPSDA